MTTAKAQRKRRTSMPRKCFGVSAGIHYPLLRSIQAGSGAAAGGYGAAFIDFLFTKPLNALSRALAAAETDSLMRVPGQD